MSDPVLGTRDIKTNKQTYSLPSLRSHSTICTWNGEIGAQRGRVFCIRLYTEVMVKSRSNLRHQPTDASQKSSLHE